MIVSRLGMNSYTPQKVRKPAFGVTLTEVYKIVTNPKNNSPHLIEGLHCDIFPRKKLENPKQKELEALKEALENNQVVGAAKATVRKILKEVKPVNP